MNVNSTEATTGATALLLPAQNTHTIHDPIRDAEHGGGDGARAGGLSAAWMAVETGACTKSYDKLDDDAQKYKCDKFVEFRFRRVPKLPVWASEVGRLSCERVSPLLYLLASSFFAAHVSRLPYFRIF